MNKGSIAYIRDVRCRGSKNDDMGWWYAWIEINEKIKGSK